MYDDDLTPAIVADMLKSSLEKMAAWPKAHPWLMVTYEVDGEQYLFFPNWNATQKPSHPTPSRLPPPPPECFPLFSRKVQEKPESPSGALRPQSSLGQVRSGKVSLGQGSFTKFLRKENMKDLTDLLTTSLTESIGRGRPATMVVVKQLWADAERTLEQDVWEMVYDALGKYPVPVMAAALAKAVLYSDNKTKPANYLKAILEEKMDKSSRKKAPPGAGK
jgi:hypothetical protein